MLRTAVLAKRRASNRVDSARDPQGAGEGRPYLRSYVLPVWHDVPLPTA
jgi:hypothetical protein